MILYKSQHLQRIIREITYSESTGILVVLFISGRIAFAVLYVKVTLDYANCGAGLVHYKRMTVSYWFKFDPILHNTDQLQRYTAKSQY